MPDRYPVEMRRQAIECAGESARVAQLTETFRMSEARRASPFTPRFYWVLLG